MRLSTSSAIRSVVAAVWITFFAALRVSSAATCESLMALRLPNTSITTAQSIAAGSFKPPKPPGLPIPAPDYTKLPAFCRVAVTVKPVKDSEIKFEIWLPIAGWNRKLLAVGNGVYSGEIWYWSMIQPLARGYATASTDTGHEGGLMDASFAAGHPEKLADFGWDHTVSTVAFKGGLKGYYEEMKAAR